MFEVEYIIDETERTEEKEGKKSENELSGLG